MTHLIEKDEATANNRTLHFRLFTSDGTTPDTGASGDSVIVARGSATTFIPDVLVVAVNAAQGMYSAILSASNVSNLGPHALYHTQGAFPQHIANFDVVNFNPYSSFSNIAVKTYSGVTVGSAATILAGTYSGVTVGINNVAAGSYSGVTIGGASFVTINPGTYSGVTFGVNNIAAGNYSGVTISGVTATNVLDKTAYGVTSIAAGTYSGVTVGSAATILVGTYSGVTLGVNNIAAGNYSGVTISGVTVSNNLDKLDYNVATIDAGAITTAAFAAAALDATVFATDAEQAFADRLLLRSIAGGADSGRTVGTALYVLRNKVDASSSVGTVYQVDDSTSAFTFSNTTGAFPISSVDPA